MNAGEVLSVTIAVGINSINEVWVIGEGDIGISEAFKGPAFVALLKIPADIALGPHSLTAIGVASAGSGVSAISALIEIDVEQPASPTALTVQPAGIGFQFAGQQIPLSVYAGFGGETNVEATESSRVTYTSTSSAVAIIDTGGIVTATGAGTAQIQVAYGSKLVQVPVSVSSTITGDLNDDGIVDQDDVNLLLDALATPASGPFDARDLNHNGVIDAGDVALEKQLCTYPGCAPF